MRKGRGKVAVIVAVILSIIIVPLLLLLGIVGATTTAFSNALSEHREDELFLQFEREGGIRWIYDEVEAELLPIGQELDAPEGMDPLKGIVTYEDVSSIAHGIYSAFLSGNQYVFDLSVQKERIRENVDAYFDKYLEEQGLSELVDSGAVDKELVKESYLKDVYTQLEERVMQVETDLNSKLEEVYHSPEFTKIANVEELRGTDRTYLELLRDGLKKAEVTAIGVMAVLALLLLLCHLFYPSGFFVAGGTAALLGVAAVVISKGIHALLFSGVVSAASLPHESLFAAAEQIVLWLSDGYLQFGIYSAVAGGILLVVGGILLIFRKKKDSMAAS